jgi:sugar-phosphatase
MEPMAGKSQMVKPFAIIISGVAGSGKTTLGRALAQELKAPLVDLDSATNPLLDIIFDVEQPENPHWLSLDRSARVREARYAALREIARDAIDTVGGVVMVAPFTKELGGGMEWKELTSSLQPADITVVHLTGDASVIAERREARQIERDLHREDNGPSLKPAIHHHPIDAELTTSQQLHRLLVHLGVRKELDPENPIFSTSFEAVLLDLDGTLIDSTASVTRSWRAFANHYGVSMEKLHENHGQTARNLVQILLPEHLHEEGLQRITDLEISDAVGLLPVPGARNFFQSVPVERRAVVTSGSIPIATARLEGTGFDIPDVLITANHVGRGKPDPEPFLLAAKLLGVDPARCLVFEDAPAGIRSARDAGCMVSAIQGTVSEAELSEADLIIDGLDRVFLSSTPDGLLTVRLARSGAKRNS